MCLSFFLPFTAFLSHSISVFLFPCVYLYVYTGCACVCVCGWGLAMADGMITGLSVPLSPQREHICSKSHSLHKHTSRLPSNKVYYVSAVPYRSDDNHSGTMKVATEGTSESFRAPGRSEIQTHKPSHSYKVAQRRLLIILAQNEGSERPIKL